MNVCELMFENRFMYPSSASKCNENATDVVLNEIIWNIVASLTPIIQSNELFYK